MQSICFALLVAGAAAGGARDDNPMQAVLTLLGGLEAKIVAEGEAEDKAFKEFKAWCDDASANAGFDIKTATSKKEKLGATIAKAGSDIEVATTQIESLASDIGASDGELKNSATIRAKEAGDFAANDAELADVVDTLGRAVSVISREMQKNPAAFAQIKSPIGGNLINALKAVVDAASLPIADSTKLVAMVQNQQNDAADDEDAGSPAAAVYQSHSGSIVDVLEDLKEKAEEELSGLRKAESNAKHNFEMLRQSLEDQMGADTKDKAASAASKSAAEETKAGAEGELSVTEKDLANSKKALEATNGQCMEVAVDHDATVKNRAEELKTIGDAKKILSDTSSGAVDQTYSFIQLNAAVGSQLRTRADLAHLEVINLVKKLAAQQHSAALAQLASRIQAVVKYGAGDDVFGKVKDLISGLIAKLEKEGAGEATEKSYCDEEMKKTTEKKDDLNADISKLTAKIDQAASKSVQLKDEVKGLQATLAALAKTQAEMDKVRQDSHAAFVQAKSDLELGLSGVQKALGLLRNYYGNAALLQSEQPAVPVFKKASGAGGSIIGVLEVVEGDFSKNLAAENMQEDDAASAYEKTTQENKITGAQKEQDIKYKTQNFKSLDKTLAELSSDRSSANTELSAVLEYDTQIKARCIAKPETYEARKERRTAEISGLREALAILEEETALVQRKKHGHHGSFLGTQ